MNGAAHSVIGAGTGLLIAYGYGVDTTTAIALVSAGTVSALVPDLDIGGKLTNRITMSDQLLKSVATLIGTAILILAFMQGSGNEKWLAILIGVGIIYVAQKLSQKMMLIITGIGVGAIGSVFSKLWLFLMGGYIIGAALSAHRSYTHSLLGLAYFAYIAHLFAVDMGSELLFYACVLGYASHLVADMRIFPWNKQGVRLLLPFSRMMF